METQAHSGPGILPILTPGPQDARPCVAELSCMEQRAAREEPRGQVGPGLGSRVHVEACRPLLESRSLICTGLADILPPSIITALCTLRHKSCLSPDCSVTGKSDKKLHRTREITGCAVTTLRDKGTVSPQQSRSPPPSRGLGSSMLSLTALPVTYLCPGL